MHLPVLVAPPSEPAVDLATVKAHLRLFESDQDALLQAYVAAATGHLDGWRGLLGRAIVRQTWRQDFPCWGRHCLALPDVIQPSVQVMGIDAEGEEIAPDRVTTDPCMGGTYVEAKGEPRATTMRVSYDCEMPAPQQQTVRQIILLLVGHWYENREAVGEAQSALPLAYEGLLQPLRWRSI